jgi:Tol biopolymer transport system component
MPVHPALRDRLTDDPATDSEPVFSPDGSKIVLNSLRDSNDPDGRMDP